MKLEIKSDCRGWSVDDTIDKIFEDREIDDPIHFLNPSPDDMLPLTDLENIDNASNIVLNGIEANMKFGLHVDCDLDGITSGTIIYRYLKKISPNIDIKTYINHGKIHGLQGDDLEKYKDRNILIIVDSLDSTAYNYENVQKDSDITDIIILDHHTVNPKVPYDKWVTLVTSQRNYGNPQLSGAGVCLKFVLYLDMLLGVNYAQEFYDLSASGLVADVMDVTVPENRYIISRGLEEIHNPAIMKLAGGFGWDSKAIAFSLAPVVNASMRLDRNEYSLKAFLSDDSKSISENIKELKKCKEEQNKEIDDLMKDITRQCEKQLDKKMMIVFIKSGYGISGVVGNKIVYKYDRPIIILNEENTDDNYYHGSMRAVGVDDFQAIINSSGLARSMGHENASGIDIKKDKLQDFIDYMGNVLPEVGAYEETVDADVWVNAEDIDENYINSIQRVNKISGKGFKPIRLYIDGITDYDIGDMSKGKHLVIKLNNCDLNLVQWNFTGDWDELEDASLLNEELECVVELQSAWIGRKFMLMGIIQWLNIKGDD